MNTKLSLISEISMPIGDVCMGVSRSGENLWIDLLVALPSARIFHFSLRCSTCQSRVPEKLYLPVIRSHLNQLLPLYHRRRIVFTNATLCAWWPEGRQMELAREFCDIFLYKFFQWPLDIYSSRSNVFKSSFSSVYSHLASTVYGFEETSLGSI